MIRLAWVTGKRGSLFWAYLWLLAIWAMAAAFIHRWGSGASGP